MKKEEVQLSPFANDIILHMESTKESTPKKMTRRISKFIEVAEDKINRKIGYGSIHKQTAI